ncbi:probable glycerol-3-phosphate O-acyltransferase (formerly described as CTR1 suppressor protein) [Serendipita indica DSM 11827]|uniref:Probable glycerol-3-phosphate O-acyltransferase (Formerly described as CTR1 suppressor protein) n=1 Tax=Serendipita indica (strain DSM 11827) TaxID=1109443 RepID=G4TLR3_SERID|nr:probable glycerol-3-phosphate O-acyltransferase (formerly described as CTR1 suppressor protein) [Serendipita indica DSM 11827]
MEQGAKSTPWTYFFIRLLFKFVLKVFYGSIILENEHFIPKRGACILMGNHSNSLTDAILLIAAIPSKRRNLLRMTAKDTQFGRKTFTSWLIESVGTVPIKRRKEHGDDADNTVAIQGLVNSLGAGDCICIFPEGMSRYHPGMAPLKTGGARIVSDTLTAQRDNPDFELTVLTCSITYMHRERFRSDVLISFNRPLKLRPKEFPQLLQPVEFSVIRSLTAFLQSQISSGTIDAPTWSTVRIAKLAARMYAPLGTRMTLGDHVRVTKVFADAFAGATPRKWEEVAPEASDWASGKSDTSTEDASIDAVLSAARESTQAKRDLLAKDLGEYQDFLSHLGIKDERLRRAAPRAFLFYRILLRLTWMVVLLTISIPGLILWAPIYATTSYAVWRFKMSGPIWDTFDEIAQYKMIYGLGSAVVVYILCILFTWPIAFITSWAVPILLWMTLRWWEDAVSAARALNALVRLFLLGRHELRRTKTWRDKLYARVMELAKELELPDDPEAYFVERGGWEKGRVRGRWASGVRYFSLTRRRKRDWNEALRWYEVVLAND